VSGTFAVRYEGRARAALKVPRSTRETPDNAAKIASYLHRISTANRIEQLATEPANTDD
jgi:hypothetical protein